jgi:HTH-type transcriptional regulator, transcriptional repressor of NAD biosynthesis genes
MNTRFESQVSAWYGGGSWGPEQEEEWKRFKEEREKREKQAPTPPPKDPSPPKQASARFAHAVVLGRFDPLHRGHMFLVDAARALAHATTVVVRTRETDAVAGDLRVAWCRELFGAAAALAIDPPAAPPTDLAFWEHWAGGVRPLAPHADVVVAADREAWRLADVLGVAFVLIDPDRLAIPISATQIRANPLAAWQDLSPPARAHYARRVVLLGPEVSGKTTLANALARRLATVCVPEQARVVAQRRGGVLRAADLAVLAAAQDACEDALARHANRVLVCDTDARSLELWGERMFGAAPRLARRAPDLYVLPEPLPFGDDAARRQFARRCRDAAQASGAPWLEVRGTVDERVAQVVDAIARRWPAAVTELGATPR